jgi:uncharacterized membrane protein
MRLFGKKIRLAETFIVIAATFGIFFVARTPLLWGTDETSHVARVYQLSQGQIWQEHLSDPRQKDVYVAYQIPQNLYKLIVAVNDDLIDNTSSAGVSTAKYVDNPAVYTRLGKLHLNGDKRIAYGFPNTAAYSPVAYTPALIGMGVANLFHADIFWMIMLIRLCDLAMFIGIVYLALRVMDAYRVKWLIFAIALLPTALYSGSIISADGVTTATVLLFAALLLKALLNPDTVIRKSEVGLLAAITVVLPLLKPGYIILLPLQLLISNKQFATRRMAYMVKIIPLAIGGMLFLLWSHSVTGAVRNEAIIRPGGGWELVNPNSQTKFILGHPFAYAKVLIRTFITGFGQYFMELVGDLGFHHVRLPGTGVILEVVGLLAAMLWAERPRIKRLIPICLLGVSFIGGLLIATTFYLAYTNVADFTVRGIQGRYFLPLLPFALMGAGLALSKFKIGKSWRAYSLVPKLICIFTVLSLTMIAIKYQLVTWG